jgi:transcriptional regulator with XRE-family HTH domain
MVMGRTVAEKIAELPADRQERIHARAKELIAEELTLQQLRKARNKTQVAVARKLNIGQDTVSRYERQADLLLSTLQRYVEAVDGKLSLLVEFPDRKPVKIGGFGELADDSRQRA